MNFKEMIKENKRKAIMTLVILLLLGIILSFKLIMFVINQNSECMNNPFVYDAQRLYDQGIDVNCACYPVDPKFSAFDYDRHNISFREIISSNKNSNFNDLLDLKIIAP